MEFTTEMRDFLRDNLQAELLIMRDPSKVTSVKMKIYIAGELFTEYESAIDEPSLADKAGIA